MEGHRFTPRGKSRIVADRIGPSWDDEKQAFVPIEGGDRSIRPLPPLRLSYEEWAMIGKRMKWWAKRHNAISKQRRSPAPPYKGPINQPCSACSAGDWKMEHHDHDYVKPENRRTTSVAGSGG